MRVNLPCRKRAVNHRAKPRKRPQGMNNDDLKLVFLIDRAGPNDFHFLHDRQRKGLAMKTLQTCRRQQRPTVVHRLCSLSTILTVVLFAWPAFAQQKVGTLPDPVTDYATAFYSLNFLDGAAAARGGSGVALALGARSVLANPA